MKNVEWQPYLGIIQTGTSAAGDITQEEDFWLDSRMAMIVILTIELLYASAAGTPDFVIEVSDDPASGIWNVAWQRSRYDSGNEIGTYLVTLSRQISVGRPFHLGAAIRWRATGFSTSSNTEIAVRILATLQ